MELKKIFILAPLVLGLQAMALEGVHKSNVQLPFHKKIDIATKNQANLENDMEKLFKKSKPTVKNSEDQMVSDFIDFEVHWGGKQGKVVDRRTNSHF